MIKNLLLLLIVISLTAMSFQQVIRVSKENIEASTQADEVLYFPKGEALSLISLGYKNTLSDYLWFQTVNYFGKHYRADRNYFWLNHMCHVVTELDPKHREVYEFCALLIAWEANSPEKGEEILKKAIKNTQFWRFYYLLGMSRLIFSKDDAGAKDYFIRCSNEVADCPSFVKEMASKKLANLNSPEEAVKFLQEMIATSKDPSQKAALQGQLDKTIHEINFKSLSELKEVYEQSSGLKLEKLEDLGLAPEALLDPFGGKYYLAPDGTIASTSNVERIKLFWEKEKNE